MSFAGAIKTTKTAPTRSEAKVKGEEYKLMRLSPQINGFTFTNKGFVKVGKGLTHSVAQCGCQGEIRAQGPTPISGRGNHVW